MSRIPLTVVEAMISPCTCGTLPTTPTSPLLGWYVARDPRRKQIVLLMVPSQLGHQNKVNHVQFSPDGTMIASAGWDNATKLWNARDGKFLKSLRGHVAPASLAP